MGQTETTTRTTHRQRTIFNHSSQEPLKNVYLKHFARRVELYRYSQRSIAKVHLPVETKSVEIVADIYRYYQARAKLPTHSNLVSLLQIQLIDSKGHNITQYINQHGSLPASSRNNAFDTVCSLSIFQTNCKRSALEKNQIKGELKLHHDYFAQNLEKQSERRRKSHQIFKEKELWNILTCCTEAANLLAQLNLKEPLLSPLAIKLTHHNCIKVGQWQFTHYFQDNENMPQQSNLQEEGETLLYHTEDTVSSTQPNQKQDFDILESYYWPPQGTNSMQNTMGIGKLSGCKQSRGQVFSLAMTILQLVLQRPLYQKQTYSEKQLSRYLQEAVSYRLRQGYPLSQSLVSLLNRMLVWDSKERISFQQLQRQLKASQGITTNVTSSDRMSIEVKSSFSNGLRTVQKRGQLSNEVEGSGIIDQGEGDESHPTPENIEKNYFTNRSKAETSLDYHKLDYTIHRQRKEWEKFENRFMQSSYKLLPNSSIEPIQIIKHSSLQSFPAEIILEDKEDSPNEQPLTQIVIESNEVQVKDEEEQRPIDLSNCVSDSIKILDLSNIKANEEETLKEMWVPLQEINQQTPGYQTRTVPQFRKNTPKQLLEEDSLLLKSSKSPQVAKFSHHQLHLNQSMGSAQNHSTLQSRNNHNNNEDLFTSPELMALIRSSARRHEEKENSYHNVKLQLSPSCVTSKVPVEMSQSTFVKEEFAKGWYEGGKLQGLRNGYGTFYYNEGGKYCGDWKENLMHGRGTLYYSDGRIAYQGEWNCDKLHGNGILYNQNPIKLSNPFDYRNFDQAEEIWIYYEGGFVNDDKSGRGVLQLSNGERFEGMFNGDVVEGKGRFFSLDGEVVIGEWSNNRLVRIESVFGSGQLSK